VFIYENLWLRVRFRFLAFSLSRFLAFSLSRFEFVRSQVSIFKYSSLCLCASVANPGLGSLVVQLPFLSPTWRLGGSFGFQVAG